MISPKSDSPPLSFFKNNTLKAKSSNSKTQKIKSVKSDNRLCAQAIEIIFAGHIPGDEILKYYRSQSKNFGLYKGFVKWHHGDPTEEEEKPHTHVAIVLLEKPQIPWDKRLEFFKVSVVGVNHLPSTVQPLGKGNNSTVKKLNRYVTYLVDGHDNGKYKDTWNYKYDHELETSKTDGKIIILLNRGWTLRQIIENGDADFQAYCFKQKDPVDKMINNWRKFYRNDSIRHKLTSFNPEPVKKIMDLWDPKKETLILKGPSNMGKTALAKALLKKVTKTCPIFCSNLNKLRYRDYGQSFILDDMNYSGKSRTKLIHLLDIENERDIRILHAIHTIEAGVGRIMTTNEELSELFPQEHYWKTEIQRRFCYIDLTTFGRLY